MSKRRKAGLVGALFGVAAAGVAAGVAAERFLVARARNRGEDPHGHEPFGLLPYDESVVITNDDGVEIYAEVTEPRRGAKADLTVILVHGFCLDMGTFHFQRRALARLDRPRVRLVAYDQPGHGRSARQPDGDYTLESLGSTLRRVIDELGGDGPIALVGHSMGGMAIMSLAERYPELFGDRIAGVVLISTSSGNLDEVTFGLPAVLHRVRRPLLPLVANASRLKPAVIDRARQVSSDLAWLLTRRYGFGTARPSPALVSYVERMNSTTSVEVIAGYVKTLFAHSRGDALAALAHIPVLVIAGDKDMLTPVGHSEEIAKLLPDAALVIIPDGGHVVLLEHPEEVNTALTHFLRGL